MSVVSGQLLVFSCGSVIRSPFGVILRPYVVILSGAKDLCSLSRASAGKICCKLNGISKDTLLL